MKDKEIHGEGWSIDPMIDVALRRRTGAKPRYLKPVAHYGCPHCSNGKVAIILDGHHLVWKPHNRTTMSGAKMLCAVSGAPLCANPPVGVIAVEHCPHR